jgi:hypothetical protein
MSRFETKQERDDDGRGVAYIRKLEVPNAYINWDRTNENNNYLWRYQNELVFSDLHPAADCRKAKGCHISYLHIVCCYVAVHISTYCIRSYVHEKLQLKKQKASHTCVAPAGDVDYGSSFQHVHLRKNIRTMCMWVVCFTSQMRSSPAYKKQTARWKNPPQLL